MAYHGYISALQNRLATIPAKSPAVLEIGVDRGVTLIPLVVAMASTRDSFLYVGVDVKVQESVQLTIQHLGQLVAKSTYLIQENSLTVLPKLIHQQMKFDLILLDGDHNYHTVSSELKHLTSLINPGGIIIVDDYDGKWSTRDLWYAQREGYEDVEMVTQPVSTDQQGVKPAVDEWLVANPEWKLYKPIATGEPVILSREPIG